MVNKSYQKICKKCKSEEIKKDGFMRGKQRYKCKFQNKTRAKKVEIKEIWNNYCFGKQTYSQLSEKHKEIIKTIQKKLDKYKFIFPIVRPREIILLMDTTYFGEFGIMAFKDYKSNNLGLKKVITLIISKYSNSNV